MIRTLTTIIFLCGMLFARNPNGCMVEDHYALARRTDKADLDTFIVCTSGDFAVHYDLTGDDAPNTADADDNDIPDYVDEVCIAADTARYVLLDVMGFLPEPEDSDGIFDIILENRGKNDYGVNYKIYDCTGGQANTGGACTDIKDVRDSHCLSLDCSFTTNGQSLIEIDNSFDESNDWYTTGLNTMRLVVAHEYFHAIQRAYKHSPNSTDQFFYELTSTWIEDVIVPDGNDYLYWIDEFFDDPDQDFDDSDGYSLALYGHYLSTQIQDTDSQVESTIMRSVWEEIEDGSAPAAGIDNVLESYNLTFIDTWVDFCARNLFNDEFTDMDNDIFYYIDQANLLVGSLHVDADDLMSGTYSLSLDDDSAVIQSIKADISSIIEFTYSELPQAGQVAIVRYNADDHQIFTPENGLSLSLNQNDKIHLVLGSTSGSQSITVDVQPWYLPIAPVMEYVDISHDEHIISWNPSPGPGEINQYQIFRNGAQIGTSSDTTYTDSTFAEDTDYWYKVTCNNETGTSGFSDSLFVTSWPSRADIINSKILNAYPNPVYTGSNFTMLIDVDVDMTAPRYELYNIRGQLAASSSGGNLVQGRHELQVSNIFSPQLPNGVYFLTVHLQGVELKQRITLIK